MIIVKHLDVIDNFGLNPPVQAVPAGILLGDLNLGGNNQTGLTVGTSIDFGKPVSYTSSLNGVITNLVVTTSASHLIIATITILGNIQVAATANSDELDVTAAGPVYLPATETPNGSFSFNLTEQAGQTVYIDPTIATGYIYATGAGNPNFASVLPPAIQTSPYLVTFINNGKQETNSVAPNTVLKFPTGGISAFTVTGISAADNISPSNPTAFVTGLTFAASGTFTGTQTPATVIEGSTKGKAVIKAGPVSNIVNAHGTGNTIIESGGNDVINAGDGSATVTTGSGDVTVNLNGKNNTVTGGNGNDTVNVLTGGNNDIKLGSGTDSVLEAAGNQGRQLYPDRQ